MCSKRSAITVPIYFHDEGKRKEVTFEPGGMLELHGGGFTDEGYSYWGERYYMADDGRVMCDSDSRSRDCDGRLDTGMTQWWDEDHQHWRTESSRQRDHEAEKAGY